MIRIRNYNTSVLGYVPSSNLKRWTRQSVDCYYNGLQCKFCKLPDDIKSQCKMKPVVLALVRKFGKPKRMFNNEDLSND